MTKYLFLIPLYNDWRSLNFLLKKINFEIANKKRVAEVIILNDASKAKNLISKKNLRYLKKISVVNLKENLGSQKAISIGLGYINSLRKKSIIICQIYLILEILGSATSYWLVRGMQKSN